MEFSSDYNNNIEEIEEDIEEEEVDCDLFAPPDGEEDDDFQENKTAEKVDLTSKRILISPSTEEYDSLVTQIQSLLREGHGETIYEVGTGEREEPGLSEEDKKASIATLHSIGEQLECEVNHLRDKQNGSVAEYLIREKRTDEDFTEVWVLMVPYGSPFCGL